MPNQRWSLDFVHNQLADGRRFRILNIDEAALADTSLSGKRVVRELDALIAQRGRPTTIVTDNGTEFTSNAAVGWAASANDYIEPQTHPERLRREFQRPNARRTSQ